VTHPSPPEPTEPTESPSPDAPAPEAPAPGVDPAPQAEPVTAGDASTSGPDDKPSFAALGLLPALVSNLERAGYRRPWAVQAAAIPPAIAGRDVIGLAPTGRGKTVAFAAPIVDAIVRDTIARSPRGRERRRAPLPSAERLRGLILCPTRELAMQVAREVEMLATGTRHHVVVAYGKVSINPQIAEIRAGCDLLVATPGRLRELISADALTLAHVAHVAVDEVDRMLDMGFLPQVRWLLERLPAKRRTSLFTATLPPAAAELAETFLTDPETIEAGRHTHTAEHVREMLVQVQNHDKVEMLLTLFRRGHGRGTLVFCGTRRRVGWVGSALHRNGIKVGQLHGDRSQRQRETALAAFQNGELDVLVCTDVAARGLHLERVRTVVNYDVPNDPEEYVHRVGRAGHGGGFGEAITLVGRRDLEKWDAIAWSVTEPLPFTEIQEFTPSERPRRDAPGGGRPDARGGARPGGRGERTERGNRGGRGGVGGGTRKSGKAIGGGGASAGGGGRRRGGPGGRGGAGDDAPAERTYVTKKQSRPGRNRSRNAARPIPPEEKPGGGVKRPKRDD
jgi:ATP-dependent RNA helicase RhlE